VIDEVLIPPGFELPVTPSSFPPPSPVSGSKSAKRAKQGKQLKKKKKKKTVQMFPAENNQKESWFFQ